MIMGYYRLGKYDDARRSMKRILGFARRFRMDNNLTNFGSDSINPTCRSIACSIAGASPAAMIRGLFEYLYRADGLTILPHIPPSITRLEQDFPIRFGTKQLYLATAGQGAVTGVTVNGQPWKLFDARSVSLPYDQTPDEAVIQIVLGGARGGAVCACASVIRCRSRRRRRPTIGRNHRCWHPLQHYRSGLSRCAPSTNGLSRPAWAMATRRRTSD